MSSQIDLSYLNLISGDDQAFIKEIVVTFLAEIDNEILLLNNYIENNEWQKAQKIAHKIKSPVHMLMADSLKNLITDMESDLKALKNIDRIPDRHKEFQELIQIAIREYQAWLAERA